MHAYLRNHPPGGCFVCLEHTTRGLNLIQLGGSLAALGSCAYELHSERHEGAPGALGTPLVLWAMLGSSIVAAVLALMAIIGISLRCAPPCKRTTLSSFSHANAGSLSILLIPPLCHRRSLQLINAYVVLAALGMSAQLVVAVVCVLKDNAPADDPPTPHARPPSTDSEAHTLAAGFLATERGAGGAGELGAIGGHSAVQLLCLAGFCLEALSLACTCMLQCTYQRAQDAAEDAAEEEEEWASRRSLLRE